MNVIWKLILMWCVLLSAADDALSDGFVIVSSDDRQVSVMSSL